MSIISYAVRIILTLWLTAPLSLGLHLPFTKAVPKNPVPGADTDKPCYAFAKNWRIVTACGGKKDWIQVPYAIEEFAVSADGAFLALWKADPIAFAHPDQAGDARWVTDFVVVSLSPGFKTIEKQANYRSVPSVIATCGTVVGFYPGVRSLTEGAWDLSAPPGAPPYPSSEDILSGKSLQFAASNIFRCSSDRQVVAALTRTSIADTRELVLSVKGSEDRRFPADSKKLNAWARDDFSVSPNGKYLAYSYTTEKRYAPSVCVSQVGASLTCIRSNGGSLSVSDRKLSPV